MRRLIFLSLFASASAFGQTPKIVFPVQYEVNKSATGGLPLFGGMFFEASIKSGQIDVTRRTVIFFKQLGGFERDDGFITSELFFRESYFEHVILKKKVTETQFLAQFIKFAEVGGNRQCALFSLTVKGDNAVRSLYACFDGDLYVIRRIEETVIVGDFSTNVTYDLVVADPEEVIAEGD